MKNKIPISYTSYITRETVTGYNKTTNGYYTLYQFFPYGVWDEHKLTLKEAIKRYPIDQYEWLFFSDDISELDHIYKGLRRRNYS